MNILLFCSNPVNGGTARIFYELVKEFNRLLPEDNKIYACVNEQNPVEIYRKISDLCRLPVFSCEELYSDMFGGTTLQKIRNKVVRTIKYNSVKKNNIEVMQNFISAHKIDHIIIHNGGYIGDDLCNQMLTAAYRCAEHMSLCRTYVLHNDMEKNICSKLRFEHYDRRISKEATNIITVSNYTKNRLEKSSFIKKDIKVIYNGLPDDRILSEIEKRKIINPKHSQFNILMIGNFLDNKGQLQFIETAALLAEKDPKYSFTIIGNVYDNDYYCECEKRIKCLHLEPRIRIYQGLNNASEYIDLFDVLAVPSMYDESFGLISVEAMMAGVPIVAFACGGIPEVVQDGRNGFIVPVGNSSAMADRIQWLAEHSNKRFEMGRRCREDFEKKFSAEQMAWNYINFLKLNNTKSGK